MHHQLNVSEEILKVADAVTPPILERYPYEVIAPNGIFKNGRLYKSGHFVQLDTITAAAFIAQGDIKENTNDQN